MWYVFYTIDLRSVSISWLVNYHDNRCIGKSFKLANSMNFIFVCRAPNCLLVLKKKEGLNSLIRFLGHQSRRLLWMTLWDPFQPLITTSPNPCATGSNHSLSSKAMRQMLSVRPSDTNKPAKLFPPSLPSSTQATAKGKELQMSLWSARDCPLRVRVLASSFKSRAAGGSGPVWELGQANVLPGDTNPCL